VLAEGALTRLDFDSSISNQSVPLQLPLHLRIEIIHLRLQVLGLAARAIDLFVLAIELPAHDLGALVPAFGVAEESVTAINSQYLVFRF
jgi:hypothetical protein